MMFKVLHRFIIILAILAPMEPYKVAVFGLGYVGLPLAIGLVKAGFEVLGVDLDQSKVDAINAGRSPIKDHYVEANFAAGVRVRSTTDARRAMGFDAFTASVPTDTYTPLRAAIRTIGGLVKRGSLVVVESTVEPGTCDGLVNEVLQSKLDRRGEGYRVGPDVSLAHCPERIDPGNPQWDVENIPRVVGADSPLGLERAVGLYSTLIGRENVRPVSKLKIAELSKVLENASRAYRIALRNRVAMACAKSGIDYRELESAAATKPFGYDGGVGPGLVGGHCLPKDSEMLLRWLIAMGVDASLVQEAIKTNEAMPRYAVDRLAEALNEVKLPINGSRTVVLGLAYKKEIGDTRDAGGPKVVKEIMQRKGLVRVYDPFVQSHPDIDRGMFAVDLRSALEGSDEAVICAAHTIFKETLEDMLKASKVKVVLDVPNVLNLNPSETSFVYRGLGF